ncbi:MAG TPA: GNAT family N-acetyltransferase [Acidimicrobiales bacterium]
MSIDFRRLARSDFGALSGWLSEPEVRRWWREDPALDAIETRYGPIVDGDDPTEVFVVVVDGVASGIIQRYRTADDPDWARALRTAVPATVRTPSAGVDYLLGRPDVRGRGVGTAAIDAFSATVFDELLDVTTIVASVQQANRASWRALERAGYRRVWAGRLDTADPSDDGPAYVLVRDREHPAPSDGHRATQPLGDVRS